MCGYWLNILYVVKSNLLTEKIIKVNNENKWLLGDVSMKIIKRSGSEVTFDIAKIMAAVAKANKEVVHNERLSDEQISKISKNVEDICQEMNRSDRKSVV